MIDLFVYGTLMRGERGHSLMGGARFVIAACTAPCYDLVDMGGYPAMVACGARSVVGEIHAVYPSALAALDAYEDVHDGFYRRERIVVAGRQVHAYLLPRARSVGRAVIPSGDWRRR